MSPEAKTILLAGGTELRFVEERFGVRKWRADNGLLVYVGRRDFEQYGELLHVTICHEDPRLLDAMREIVAERFFPGRTPYISAQPSARSQPMPGLKPLFWTGFHELPPGLDRAAWIARAEDPSVYAAKSCERCLESVCAQKCAGCQRLFCKTGSAGSCSAQLFWGSCRACGTEYCERCFGRVACSVCGRQT